MMVTAGIGSWRAAASSDLLACEFAPAGWLKGESVAGITAVSGIAITVEVARHIGGMMPWALLGARFEPSVDGLLTVEVGHTGDWQLGGTRSCEGPLGRPLSPALPLEVARGALAGIIGSDAPVPGGRVVVVGGGYDEVESSFYIFERAGHLLRILLPRIATEGDITKQALDAALQDCAATSTY